MCKGNLFVLSVLITVALADDPLCVGLPSDKEILFPSPLTCEDYFKCFNGSFSIEKCLDGLVFSERWQDCVSPEYSECTGGTAIPSIDTSSPDSSTVSISTTQGPLTTQPWTTTTPSQPTTTDGDVTTDDNVDPRCIDDSTAFWPHPSRCDKYVECYLGGSYQMDCPPGTYFSDNHKMCVNAQESECCLNNPSLCVQ